MRRHNRAAFANTAPCETWHRASPTRRWWAEGNRKAVRACAWRRPGTPRPHLQRPSLTVPKGRPWTLTVVLGKVAGSLRRPLLPPPWLVQPSLEPHPPLPSVSPTLEAGRQQWTADRQALHWVEPPSLRRRSQALSESASSCRHYSSPQALSRPWFRGWRRRRSRR